ncbi:MAG: helix-turn-helix domain-containing protein [Aliidongia sp.]
MRPVELAFQIVELVGLHQPVGVSELARLAGLPKTTAHRILQALHQTGWIVPDDGDRPHWALTGRAMVTCGRATRLQSVLRGVALPVMEEMRRLTEETIHLTWRHEMSLVLLERLDGIKPVRYFFPYAGQATLHATPPAKRCWPRSRWMRSIPILAVA